MSKFQLILLIVFGAFILIAVGIFSLGHSGGSNSITVSVWGPYSSYDFSALVSNSGIDKANSITFNYTQKSMDSLDSEFTNALAVGSGPDLIIIPQDLVWKERNKILQIPYSSLSQAAYQNAFIDEGNLFLTQSGIYALPLDVDPMVMYWNRDIFNSASLATPISYWDQIYAATASLTKKDAAGNITQSAIALGETKNIDNAKDILSLLLLQAGTPITAQDQNQGLASQLSSGQNQPTIPGNAAVDFYTQFSDPSKPFYSWNRSLLPAQTSFISGSSAMYLGFASELSILHAKNPTLNFAVAAVPQSRTAPRTTFGRLYGVAISRGSKSPADAMKAALAIISNPSASALTSITGLPPARRDLLSVQQSDPAMAIFYSAALQSKGWLDPDPSQTGKLFIDLINSVTSGQAQTTEAVNNANQKLNVIIQSTR